MLRIFIIRCDELLVDKDNPGWYYKSSKPIDPKICKLNSLRF